MCARVGTTSRDGRFTTADPEVTTADGEVTAGHGRVTVGDGNGHRSRSQQLTDFTRDVGVATV